ncbi:MAG: cytochrome c oxidase accessory protein CcoG [Phycisphaerales bacterium]
MSTSAAADYRVLSTLNADGSRRWLRPKPSPGRWLNRRRLLGYFLIVLFVTLPHLRILGKPPILLDIAAREFTFVGLTLYPTDTLLLALLVLMVFLSVFFLTAMFGRVWCGWACPQTVYLELVFRPIERLFEGQPGRTRKTAGWRKPAKFFTYFVLAVWLAHTFLAYFVPTTELYGWMTRSPLQHPVSFLLVVAVTGLMLFDFGFFREQVCIVACPYGRFQSVMLDRDSLIIGYDRNRGEPRGKGKRTPRARDDRGRAGRSPKDIALPVAASGEPGTLGDCIDCRMCVTTCPTGIDIRDGLQMECVNCTQCIDACDSVMDKIGLPRGLVRYSSQRSLEEGRRRLVRPRVVVYPTIILILLTAFVTVLSMRGPFHASVLRGPGMPFTVMEDGSIANPIRVKIHNRSRAERSYRLELVGAEGGQIVSETGAIVLGPGERFNQPMLLRLPRAAFVTPRLDVGVRVIEDAGASSVAPYRALGPAARADATAPPAATPTQGTGAPDQPRPATEDAHGDHTPS